MGRFRRDPKRTPQLGGLPICTQPWPFFGCCVSISIISIIIVLFCFFFFPEVAFSSWFRKDPKKKHTVLESHTYPSGVGLRKGS